ncbi:MAG TPA: DUF5655 domain-containing protein [Acidimicrobiales bacterium]|nr:DUF5655 domain-containing protein [Acidimicrobiales bacterium]
MPWVCPECQRQFRRNKQSHECAPAMTLEEYFSTGPARERPIYEKVKAHLDTVGTVHVEPVSVGIFLKRSSSFAQLRTRRDWVALSFSLDRAVAHPRITRKVMEWHGRWYHVANVRGPEDLDDRLLGWVAECYLQAPD